MSYTALYRKYRPSVFADVKGQDHIVTTLKNQIRADRIGHAYLFCGTRGTGKTTVAKIFARAVNCEHPADGSPCGECPTCRAIASGAALNVVEMDAASNNSVEDVRRIIEEVAYPPTAGRFKVYIVDEVHMLSGAAFNAFLKVLEEPPAYVVFILATTEAHKIPVTILSRCQRYDFRRISIETISDRLKALLAQEQVEAEDAAVRCLARAADGSMRDALSLLDQCIAFYLGEKLTYDHVLEVLGAADTEVFSRLLRAILKKDAAAAIRILEEMILQGRELGQFVTDFVWYLRNLLMIKTADKMEEVLDMSGENLALLKEEARMADSDVIMRYIRVLSELSSQLRYATQKRVLIEIALIKLCRPSMETTQDALADRVATLEQKVKEGIAVVPQPAVQAVPEMQKAEKPKPVMPKAVPEDVRRVIKNWDSIIGRMPGATKGKLRQAVKSLDEEGRLLLVFDDADDYDFIMMGERPREITEIITKQTGRDMEILFRKNDTGRPADETYPNLDELEGIIHFDNIETEDTGNNGDNFF